MSHTHPFITIFLTNFLNAAKDVDQPLGIPVSELVIGCPREIQENERRVALTPENVSKLIKLGYKVVVEVRYLPPYIAVAAIFTHFQKM